MLHYIRLTFQRLILLKKHAHLVQFCLRLPRNTIYFLGTIIRNASNGASKNDEISLPVSLTIAQSKIRALL